MHLVKGFTNCDAALFQLHLHERQAVHQDGHVVAVGVGAGLLKLLDHLHLVAGDVLLVQQVDVLNAAIVKHEVVDIVILNLAGLLHDAVAGPVQPGFHKARPLTI